MSNDKTLHAIDKLYLTNFHHTLFFTLLHAHQELRQYLSHAEALAEAMEVSPDCRKKYAEIVEQLSSPISMLGEIAGQMGSVYQADEEVGAPVQWDGLGIISRAESRRIVSRLNVVELETVKTLNSVGDALTSKPDLAGSWNQRARLKVFYKLKPLPERPCYQSDSAIRFCGSPTWQHADCFAKPPSDFETDPESHYLLDPDFMLLTWLPLFEDVEVEAEITLEGIGSHKSDDCKREYRADNTLMECKAMIPSLVTKLRKLTQSIDRTYTSLRRVDRVIDLANAGFSSEFSEIHSAVANSHQRIQELSEKIKSKYESSELLRYKDWKALSDADIEQLLLLNHQLRDVGAHLRSVADDVRPRLENKLADPTDLMYDYEIEAKIDFILREDDPEYEEDEDNILTSRSEVLTRQREGRCDDYSESTELGGLHKEPHCWHFRDLCDHDYGEGGAALSFRDCLRIGKIYIDVQVCQQYQFDVGV